MAVRPQADDGGKWHQAPTVDQKDGINGETRFAQPHRALNGCKCVTATRTQVITLFKIESKDPFPPDGAEQRWAANPRRMNQKRIRPRAAKAFSREMARNVAPDGSR